MESAESTLHNINYGEERGARRRNRYIATQARQQAAEQQAHRLSKPPATSSEAASRWDDFYKTKPTLFKDRHVLRSCFPELVDPTAAANPKNHFPPLTPDPLPQTEDSFTSLPNPMFINLAMEKGHHITLLEAGCGTGNTLFPLLRANSKLYILAFDFSEQAVKLVRENNEYRQDRVHAFTADVTNVTSYEPCVRAVRSNGVDFVTSFWTLSALDRRGRENAVKGLAKVVREGGYVFIRDYGAGDMREQKFAHKGRRVNDDEGVQYEKDIVQEESQSRLFLRGDGTFAYFFEIEELKQLFQNVNLICESCEYEDRIVENRKDCLVMRRRWIQAKFYKPVKDN